MQDPKRHPFEVRLPSWSSSAIYRFLEQQNELRTKV
jgi:hypothetical protein